MLRETKKISFETDPQNYLKLKRKPLNIFMILSRSDINMAAVRTFSKPPSLKKTKFYRKNLNPKDSIHLFINFIWGHVTFLFMID